ncbi:MAG: (Fe-S)-binding protein [Flavobacteriales bacterium]|nr:(Fe-S)-binding protein [Flavobacteriales bacterium]
MGITNIVFILLFAGAFALFGRNILRIRRNILMGKSIDRSDARDRRWKTMIRVALGQSKMTVRPLAGIMHIFVYVGFVLINLEMLEIVIDGVLGTHRIFADFLGSSYRHFINAFEFLGVLVVLGCLVFLLRRNVARILRFHKPEMKGWPSADANVILIVEILLMTSLFVMNAADSRLMNMDASALSAFGLQHYAEGGVAGFFAFSSLLLPLLPDAPETLAFIERFCWWFHILGILVFLNYLVISKHLHIILAFPNTWFSNLAPMGRFTNLESVTNEVKLMLDPSADPYAAPPSNEGEPQRFGARDVKDLTWKQLLDAYTCTECGRCTSECPANLTGKKLSPRKIVMDTRDRLEEVGKNIEKHGADYDDGKSLLHNYITPEEIWACTTCNACVQACPVNIDPLSIIVDLRRYLVMEESAAPTELNGMFTNIENNGAPWQFSQSDRLNWTQN